MAKKRAPGEGSIHQRRDGRWEASRTVGRTKGGNPRRVRAYGRTKGEAIAKLDKALTELGGVVGAGIAVDPGTLTVAGLLERWLRMKAGVGGLKETTITSYRWYLNHYVVPAIGAVPLRRLRSTHVQELLSNLAAGIRPEPPDQVDGEESPAKETAPLSPRVIRYVWTLLNGACRHAVRLELLRSNPCDQVSPPRGGRTKVPQSWTPDEVERLLAAAAATSPALRPLYYLAVTTGLRRGELLALRWEDLDLVEGLVTVRSSRDAAGVTTTPKTAAGVRQVPISTDAVTVLEDHLQAQHERRELAIEAGLWQETGYVFTTSTGRPVAARNLLHNLERLCRRAAIRRLPFHALRHTAATLALRSGVPIRDLADRLGHRHAAFTLNVYTHVLQESARAAALTLEELLQGKKAEPAELKAEHQDGQAAPTEGQVN
jgi:integrase